MEDISKVLFAFFGVNSEKELVELADRWIRERREEKKCQEEKACSQIP